MSYPTHRHRVTGFAFALTVALTCALGIAKAEEGDGRYTQRKPSADGIGKIYMGREIAGVMGWQAARWLERVDRDREERSDLLIKRLDLQTGMVIADVGAGTGYYARRLSKAVGATGRVYAVDVQPEMLRLLTSLAQGPEFANIRPVLGAVDDARLPAGEVDLAVMVDVYHELEFPYEMLASLLRSLKPGGRLVFVEYRAEDETVPIKPLHKMSVAQVRREAAALGLELQDSVRDLPWQHVLIFGRSVPK